MSRLAALLWRLRRLSAIETGLLQIQADALLGARPATKLFDILYRGEPAHPGKVTRDGGPKDLARCFLRVAGFNRAAAEMLGDYTNRLHAELALLLSMLSLRPHVTSVVHASESPSKREIRKRRRNVSGQCS